MTAVIEEIETVDDILLAEEGNEALTCECWHDDERRQCDQEPKFIAFLIQCRHTNLCCMKHRNIFEFGRMRMMRCSCGETGWSIDMEFVAL